MRDRSPATRTLFDQFQEAFHSPQTHAFIVDALERLIDERHAQFNDTLYQLEPDVKDAPGGLRDLVGGADDRHADRPGAAARRDRRIPRGSIDAEDFLLRIRSMLHLEAGAITISSATRCRSAPPSCSATRASRRSQRVERLMGDYFRHARAVDRALRLGVGARRPLPVGANLVAPPTASGSSIAERRPRSPETWLALFQAAIDARLRGVRRRAGLHAAERRAVLAPPTSFRRRPTARRCCGS